MYIQRKGPQFPALVRCLKLKSFLRSFKCFVFCLMLFWRKVSIVQFVKCTFNVLCLSLSHLFVLPQNQSKPNFFTLRVKLIHAFHHIHTFRGTCRLNQWLTQNIVLAFVGNDYILCILKPKSTDEQNHTDCKSKMNSYCFLMLFLGLCYTVCRQSAVLDYWTYCFL